jgi:hypothetical protein
MFVGLNPSTANEDTNDPTIRSVIRIAKYHGYGGAYMTNGFSFVSTDPSKLVRDEVNQALNDLWLVSISKLCATIVFAWGTFNVMAETGRDKELGYMFPQAMALGINKNGSPKHPLYCKTETALIPFR